MKTNILGIILACTFCISHAYGQGTLTPPGAPAPTMKSLSQIEPRIPISSVPYVISSPGAYYATGNLVGTNGQHGITISSSDVTIDLNGFTLLGVPGAIQGVFINNTRTNITIRNGAIDGWGADGIYAHNGSAPRNMVFENLNITLNAGYGIEAEAGTVVRNCLLTSNRLAGVIIYGGQVSDCVARGNATIGIQVFDGSVRGCSAEYNGSHGIFVAEGMVRDCQSQSNGAYGIYLSQSSARDCQSQFNSQYGFYLIQGSSVVDSVCLSNANTGILCDLLGNDVRGCKVYGNPGVGIQFNGPGIAQDNYVVANSGYGIMVISYGCQVLNNNFVSNSLPAIFVLSGGNRIDNNSIVTLPGTTGITVANTSSTNNVVTRNSVVGNGASGYAIVAGNDVGPIGNASTNMSPWANFTH